MTMTALSELFLSGNIICMSILTLLLALLFLAAWKTPAWVRNVGLIALTSGILFGLLGFYQIYDYQQQAGDVAPAVLFGGYKCAIIPAAYGLIINIISLVINLCQTPKI